ncbi:hypothetical protein ACSYDW_07920 [Paeniglutamicibacter sp. R2-26]|uniref:hypothetical protein n=1 Tax=Paeniglutamicibacter sp. R2-26 TaxID=3144417 RepID=UPI003EE72EE7
MPTHAEKQMNDITRRLECWSRKAKQEYPQQLEDSLRRIVDRIDPEGLARASEDVLATVTGNHAMARRARKSIGRSLSSAQRKYGTHPSKARGALVVLGVTCLIAAACAAAMWRATHRIEPMPKPTYDPGDAGYESRGVDPDLR